MPKSSKNQTRNKNNRKMHAAIFKDDDDERFLDLSKNPMFREQKKKEHKIVVDSRFQQMLSDKRFEERDFRVDKRGKPIKKAAGDNFLTNLYHFDDEDKQESESSGEEELPNESGSDDEANDANLPIQLDLARGEAPAQYSSSSEDEEDVDFDRNNYGNEEIDTLEDSSAKEIRQVEWASSRLAICNMDWNKLEAEDLYIVLNSFKPPSALIYSVAVYLSDFGAEVLEEEKKSGPKLKLKAAKKGDFHERTKQAIRDYESEKLRYYYAVCECDSHETATAIYEACDGVEYGASGIRFDIRFIPDETKFEEKRLQSRITSKEFNLAKYKPKRTSTHSLQLSNPKISWEEKDSERKYKMKQAFEKEAKLDEFESLVAPGSDVDDEEEQKSRYQTLINAAKEALETKKNNSEDEAEKDKEAIEENEDEPNNFNNEQIVTASEDEDSALVHGKKKTKFQIYLERKKQLKAERKQKGIEQRKSLKKRKLQNEEMEELQKSRSSIAAQVDQDKRFGAFFKNSDFAIDRTHAQYKGGNLAITQVYGKKAKSEEVQIKKNDKGGNKESGNSAIYAEPTEMLVNRLKAKQKRRQKED